MQILRFPAEAFVASLAAADKPGFSERMRDDIAALPEDCLPLAAAMAHGSMPVAGSVRPVIYAVEIDAEVIRVHVSLFYHSIEAGCACENDPTPINDLQECADCTLELRPAEGLYR